MTETIEELRDVLEKSNIEQQRKLLQEFIESSTNDHVIEGIRIANESLSNSYQEFSVSSYVKE